MITQHPIHNVQWVHIDQVKANNYNPNSVAKNEMNLLYTSIKQDGYTQPVVTFYDSKLEKYIIVDGFHRYSIMKMYKDIYETTDGKLPIVVIKKDISERMASTIRHNRARGKHSIDGMSNIVFNMLDKGIDDKTICQNLGLEPEELIRLKHITGFSKLFKDTKYSKAWETRRQLELRREYENREDKPK
tara:strand:+ start:1403 stop:1966 length:564 start_codon:yes stop_codon:yes gene_type:complete